MLEQGSDWGLGKIGNLLAAIRVSPRRLHSGVGRQIDSREGSKLVCKVSLIVKPAIDRDFGPWNIDAGV